jgi:hypothetical protein
MGMRTRVYTSILRWLSDRRWHKTSELALLTRYQEEWLRELSGDPQFEVDAEAGRIRLR